jgi:hypothetical protein
LRRRRKPTEVAIGLLTSKEHDREIRKLVEILLDNYKTMAEKGDALAKLDGLTR